MTMQAMGLIDPAYNTNGAWEIKKNYIYGHTYGENFFPYYSYYYN
jgi:hypothetical protein